MTDEIIKLLLSFIIGMGLMWLLIGEPEIPEPVVVKEYKVDETEKHRADSLAKVLDSTVTKLNELNFVYEEIKTTHREQIDDINNLSIHDIFCQWSGQCAEDNRRQAGTAGGLYK